MLRRAVLQKLRACKNIKGKCVSKSVVMSVVNHNKGYISLTLSEWKDLGAADPDRKLMQANFVLSC